MNWNDLLKEIENMTSEERNQNVCVLDGFDVLCIERVKDDSGEKVLSTSW